MRISKDDVSLKERTDKDYYRIRYDLDFNLKEKDNCDFEIRWKWYKNGMIKSKTIEKRWTFKIVYSRGYHQNGEVDKLFLPDEP